MPIDIHSQAAYPACELSNFATHPFMLDGVYIASMEGFLQAIKFSEKHKQLEICRLSGLRAKRAGAKQHWQKTQTLHWDGRSYDRHSSEYMHLLLVAYDEQMQQSTSFMQALADTGEELLTHSIGSDNPYESVLTRIEFCAILMKVRDDMHVLLDALERHG